ncbi:MAG: hypothetical protein DMF87_06175, partial [Acidobacteria bacterium]
MTTTALPHDCSAPDLNDPTFAQHVRTVLRRAADDIRARVGIAALFILATSAAIFANGDNACHCAITSTDAPLVEWDLMSPMDFRSGAITVDVHNASHKPRLWMVSRAGDVKLYRFQPGKKMATDVASWRSYDLNPASLTTGGLHRIK